MQSLNIRLHWIDTVSGNLVADEFHLLYTDFLFFNVKKDVPIKGLKKLLQPSFMFSCITTAQDDIVNKVRRS